MKINRLDHLVLTVRDLNQSIDFYCNILGMRRVDFGNGRIALAFGKQKINLHLAGHELEPKSITPTPGSADICLIVEGSLDDAVAELTLNNVELLDGPVSRTGAMGPIKSIYFRDPDLNLIEISVYE